MLAASVLEKYLVMQLACLLFTPLAIVAIYEVWIVCWPSFFPHITAGMSSTNHT